MDCQVPEWVGLIVPRSQYFTQECYKPSHPLLWLHTMTRESGGLLDRLNILESQFYYQQIAPDDKPWFRSQSGSVPVLISAPHACMHQRDGRNKMQEEYTAAIAFYLAEVCQCSAVATCYKIEEDPNWDMHSDYKAAIESLVFQNNIQFLIDLHGMTNRYNMGVAIGTMRGASCKADIVTPHFVKAGFNYSLHHQTTDSFQSKGSHQLKDSWRTLIVDHPKFTGGLVNATITRFASQQLNIRAVQILQSLVLQFDDR